MELVLDAECSEDATAASEMEHRSTSTLSSRVSAPILESVFAICSFGIVGRPTGSAHFLDGVCDQWAEESCSSGVNVSPRSSSSVVYRHADEVCMLLVEPGPRRRTSSRSERDRDLPILEYRLRLRASSTFSYITCVSPARLAATPL